MAGKARAYVKKIVDDGTGLGRHWPHRIVVSWPMKERAEMGHSTAAHMADLQTRRENEKT